MSSLVLVINAGSSSLKYSLVDGESGESPASGSVEPAVEPVAAASHA